MSDTLSYIIIGGIFLGGMIPLVAGIVHYIKDNQRLDILKKAQALNRKN